MDLLRIRSRRGEISILEDRIYNMYGICVFRSSININSERKKGFEFSSALVRNYKNPSHRDHRGISSLDGST